MEGFVRIGQTLINTDRLIVVGPSPKVREGFHLAVWDTGQELMLSKEDADALAAVVATGAKSATRLPE